MNTGNMTNDEANKIANFITGFKLIHSNTPVNQLITDIRTKDFAVFNEKQLIIETFKYAQVLHATVLLSVQEFEIQKFKYRYEVE